MKEKDRIELGQRIQALTKKSTPAERKQLEQKRCAATGGQSTNTAEDGGNTVFHDISPDILSPDFASGSLYSASRIINVGPKSNGLKIPVSAETVRNVNSVKGGVRAYVIECEGDTKTASVAKFGQLDLALNKAAVVIFSTDELLQDAEAIADYLSKCSQDALLSLVDSNILYGGGLLNGLNVSPATAFVATSDPITIAEIHNMMDMYYGGKNGAWYVSKNMRDQILDLYSIQVADLAAPAATHLDLAFEDGVYYLFGYPIVVSDMVIDNGIALLDLTQYIIIQKEVKTAINTSLKWLEDESAFRWVIRMNGDSTWLSPITLTDGSVTYPFVMNVGQENSSSSSSSSNSSSSNSSSSSSSSSYIENWSSSSETSVSNSSESSQSNSSESSASSTSVSTESSESSVEYSSESSTSVSTESSESSGNYSQSSESSSQSGMGSCAEDYCASGFTHASWNGDWTVTGTKHDNKPTYYSISAGKYLFYDITYTTWAVADSIGAAPLLWDVTQTSPATCPQGAYSGDDNGTFVAGKC